MSLIDQVTSALGQVVFAILVGFLVFLFARFVWPRDRSRSFLRFIGFKFDSSNFDGRFFLVLLGVVCYGCISVVVQFYGSLDLRNLLLDESSPYFKIIKSHQGATSYVVAMVYCFIQSGGAEEILFRGVIAKRLFSSFGHLKGNILQSLMFWLMHWVIFGLVTGSWFSLYQMFILVSVFGLGMLLGYVNYRKNGQSIAPSWIIHSSANMATFLTLMFLIKINHI